MEGKNLFRSTLPSDEQCCADACQVMCEGMNGGFDLNGKFVIGNQNASDEIRKHATSGKLWDSATRDRT